MHPSANLKSSLDYLQYLMQSKYYVNHHKYNINAIQSPKHGKLFCFWNFLDCFLYYFSIHCWLTYVCRPADMEVQLYLCYNKLIILFKWMLIIKEILSILLKWQYSDWSIWYNLSKQTGFFKERCSNFETFSKATVWDY